MPGALGQFDGVVKIVGSEFFPVHGEFLLSAERRGRGDAEEKK